MLRMFCFAASGSNTTAGEPSGQAMVRTSCAVASLGLSALLSLLYPMELDHKTSTHWLLSIIGSSLPTFLRFCPHRSSAHACASPLRIARAMTPNHQPRTSQCENAIRHDENCLVKVTWAEEVNAATIAASSKPCLPSPHRFHVHRRLFSKPCGTQPELFLGSSLESPAL